MSVVQHDLLGHEMPDPITSFVLLVKWYDNELRVEPIPLTGVINSGFLQELADDVKNFMIEEYTE